MCFGFAVTRVETFMRFKKYMKNENKVLESQIHHRNIHDTGEAVLGENQILGEGQHMLPNIR